MKSNLYPEFKILLVDDEPAWLRSLSRSLQSLGGFSNLLRCSDSREVLQLLTDNDIGLILLDLSMPHRSGEELLQLIRDEYPAIAVIILSGFNQLETAVRCMRLGAYDYFVKTDDEERLLDGIRRAVQVAELQRENDSLRRNFFNTELAAPEVFAPLITRNATMLAAFRYLEAIAPSRQPLLVLGESGVGKELVARAIHQLSAARGELIAVNVAGLDDNAFSDTLFGHKRGAFTGADRDRGGMIERAAGGTLFLDEIGDLSAASQVKLLRLLQEGEYYPLGSDYPQQLRARVICATHQDLQKKVAAGEFRRDLYFRLQTHQIEIPPLRERYEDLPLLLDYFLQQAAAELGRVKPTPPPQLAILLATYSFPGNIRELRSMVFDAVSVHRGGVLSMKSFSQRLERNSSTVLTVRPTANPFLCCAELPTLGEASELLIAAALERSSGNQTLAARLLGIAQPSLSKRLKRQRTSEGS
jgi:DNA-binding NtrC family response regulator